MYADVAGNIRYVRTGRVPVRPPGFDFSRPVPGDTSSRNGLGIDPMQDLVQVLNPPCGYLQNCNISPDMMARNLGLDPAAYPSYIFHSAAAQRTRVAAGPWNCSNASQADHRRGHGHCLGYPRRRLRGLAGRSPPRSPGGRSAQAAQGCRSGHTQKCHRQLVGLGRHDGSAKLRRHALSRPADNGRTSSICRRVGRRRP